MRHFHVHVSVIKKGGGRKRVAYILRLEKHEHREDLSGRRVGNLPRWPQIPRPQGDVRDEADEDQVEGAIIFFAAADRYERKNGAVAKEATFAIPRELSERQRNRLIDLLIGDVASNCHAYCLGVHIFRRDDGQGNPHLHLMWSERIDDGRPRDAKTYFSRAAPQTYRGKRKSWDGRKGGCRKSRRFALFARAKGGYAASPELLRLRAWWADQCNAALAESGLVGELSPKSNKARGIEQNAGRHVGPAGARIEARGGISVRAEADRRARAGNVAPRPEPEGAPDSAPADASGAQSASLTQQLAADALKIREALLEASPPPRSASRKPGKR